MVLAALLPTSRMSAEASVESLQALGIDAQVLDQPNVCCSGEGVAARAARATLAAGAWLVWIAVRVVRSRGRASEAL